MGILSLIANRRVYLDTNVFIYALEAYAPFEKELRNLFDALDNGKLEAITSELTLAEALVKPFSDRSIERQHAYKEILQSTAAFQVVPVDRQILCEAARLRAEMKVRLPDAIHLATAHLQKCTAFLTNDLRLRQFSEIEMIPLSAIAGS